MGLGFEGTKGEYKEHQNHEVAWVLGSTPRRSPSRPEPGRKTDFLSFSPSPLLTAQLPPLPTTDPLLASGRFLRGQRGTTPWQCGNQPAGHLGGARSRPVLCCSVDF